MKTRFFLFIICVFLASCELIRITEKKKSAIIPEPSTSLGTVFLLIQETKNHNLSGACKLFLQDDSDLSSEKVFELEDRLKRFGSTISNREITIYKVDTLNAREHLVFVEFDYILEYFFITQKLENYWLIRNFGEKK